MFALTHSIHNRHTTPLNNLSMTISEFNFFHPFPGFKHRKCYQCTSMKECEMAKPQTCPNEDDQCYKISTDVTHKDSDVQLKTYSKGCATKSQCKDKDAHVFYQTCSEADSNCDMSCCEEDMCNAGSNFVISTFALLACALLAVVRL